MPSPFPGMDPYLEEPGLWPDVHHGLISEIPVPLRQGDPDTSLDLQAILASAFERGAYDLDLDYAKDPVPAVAGEHGVWVRKIAGDAVQSGS